MIAAMQRTTCPSATKTKWGDWISFYFPFIFLLFSYKQDCLQESESFHLNSSNFQSLVSCGLAGLPHVPVFSRVGGDEMNQMKVKVLSYFWISLLTFLECQCLIRSGGRKYSYDDSINQNIQAFSCSKRTTNKHHIF